MKTERLSRDFPETFQAHNFGKSDQRDTFQRPLIGAWKVCLSKMPRLATKNLESLTLRLTLTAIVITRLICQ